MRLVWGEWYFQNGRVNMSSTIRLFGVNTNNLKNIDVQFFKNNITAITGISGGGKSSLAYGSLYELSRQEFNSIESGYFDNSNYKIEKAENIIPAVGLKQKNTNINPRSTIYSYLNFSSLISSVIFHENISVKSEHLKINKPANYCKSCDGMGEVFTASTSKVVDFNKKIKDNPFIPWCSNISDKKYKLLLEYCNDEKISLDCKFSDLTIRQKQLLTEVESTKDYEINFKHVSKRRKKKLKFVGVIREINDDLHFGTESSQKSVLKYCQSNVCSSCHGSRIDVDTYKSSFICGIPFYEFLSKPIKSLVVEINKASSYPLQLHKMLTDINRIGLGYLSLSRSIPTLSGGELQKLNFSKLCNSAITGIMIVIDEISSQVHACDFSVLINEIKGLKDRGNTIVLVEHNEHFIRHSDHVLEIGPFPGDKGGYLLNPQQEITSTTFPLLTAEKQYAFFSVKNINKNNVCGVDLKIPENAVVALVGKSGSGKSSVAKHIYETFIGCTYISQDLIKGNIRSTVATLTGLNKKVSKIFSLFFSMDDTFFSINESSPIVCTNCCGKGVIKVSRSFERDIEMVCPACEGRLFNEHAERYKINDLSIKDIYDLSFETICELKFFEPNLLLENAIKLGLGHLSLNRKSQTLSGGELKRLKILINLPVRNRSDRILIIDEPGSGLDDRTSLNVISFIKEFAINFKSIIIIDHKPPIFLNSDYVIELGPESGDGGGKVVFTGSAENYYNEKYVMYIHDL